MKQKTKTNSILSMALPGGSLSLEDFKKEIVHAENGEFYTIEDSKKIIATWREQRNSK